jgi:hypothetical protein
VAETHAGALAPDPGLQAKLEDERHCQQPRSTEAKDPDPLAFYRRSG